MAFPAFHARSRVGGSLVSTRTPSYISPHLHRARHPARRHLDAVSYLGRAADRQGRRASTWCGSGISSFFVEIAEVHPAAGFNLSAATMSSATAPTSRGRFRFFSSWWSRSPSLPRPGHRHLAPGRRQPHSRTPSVLRLGQTMGNSLTTGRPPVNFDAEHSLPRWPLPDTMAQIIPPLPQTQSHSGPPGLGNTPCSQFGRRRTTRLLGHDSFQPGRRDQAVEQAPSRCLERQCDAHLSTRPRWPQVVHPHTSRSTRGRQQTRIHCMEFVDGGRCSGLRGRHPARPGDGSRSSKVLARVYFASQPASSTAITSSPQHPDQGKRHQTATRLARC